MNTYKRKTPEDLNCGITLFTKVLGGKWKPCIVDLIHNGYQRPSEIHRQLSSATPRVVDIQLSELEEYGIVSKKVQDGFPLRVDYSLTEMGLSILPIIYAMDRWGVARAEQIKEVHSKRELTANNFSLTE
ncbi:transcriptional regulator, HxlR family [Chitinophaga sp. CF118]|uniref:winged helix-turn-helix transcriptional regulator n=1 Tax=Chitinophaga sp. CF118 TaxID=1884367 RepID=UPI0008EB6CA9|nr:helix-turn-helix domain-containing protein [Chitinophaga sp. CF118]SFE98572.1 transcriptional regulator, HxlR family [Chitinophaga sp. CF118]